MKTAKTSKSSFLQYAPISRKAYLDFIARIYYMFPLGSSESDDTPEELDYYIITSTLGKVSEKLKYAFKFIAMDIDSALARSGSARLRREDGLTPKVESYSGYCTLTDPYKIPAPP